MLDKGDAEEMTDQKTPLKTKAKTLTEWNNLCNPLHARLMLDIQKGLGWSPEKTLVLLSVVEPLELEIQQLKKTNELLVKNLNFEIRNRMKLEKQIETAKTILNNELKRSQDELESAKANRKWDIKYWKGRKDSIEKLLLEKEVFGETET